MGYWIGWYQRQPGRKTIVRVIMLSVNGLLLLMLLLLYYCVYCTALLRPKQEIVYGRSRRLGRSSEERCSCALRPFILRIHAPLSVRIFDTIRVHLSLEIHGEDARASITLEPLHRLGRNCIR